VAGEPWLSEFHTLDLRDLCRGCVTTLAARLGSARASLYLLDAQEELLTLADSTAEQAVEVTIPVAASSVHAAAEAVRSLKPVRAGDALAVPLHSNQRACGVLWLEGSPDWARLDDCSLRFIGRCLGHARAYDCASREARLDCLTGLHNLRWMTDALRREIRRAERDGTPVSILAVDLDDLKTINDTHGHVVGDSVLRHVAGKVRAVLRDVDAAARVGGDEFVVLLPETDLEGSLQVAERVRRIVRDDAPILEHVPLPVSVSVGAAQWRPGLPLDQLLHEADQAMYRAKTGTRRPPAQ
jgi:diguanylate cyclase (GGDEF)-like protein